MVAGRDEPAAGGLDAIPHDERRLELIYEISARLLAFESIERTFDGAVEIVARTLPLVSAILVERTDDKTKTFVWASERCTDERLAAAKANARALYARLCDVPESDAATGVEPERISVIPGSPALEGRCIVIPLVVGRGPIFGALQMEIAGPVAEHDIRFVNAIANQLSVALVRRRSWDRDIASRDSAEMEAVRSFAELEFTRAVTLSLDDGVIAIDLDARITFVNAAAVTMLEVSEREACGVPLAELLRIAATDEREVELPLGPALALGAHARSDEHVLVRRDGARVPVSYRIAPIRSDGRITGGVVTLEDISERRAVEADQRCLLEVSKLLIEDLDVPGRLDAVARLLVPRLGDTCVIEIIDGARIDMVARASCSEPAGARDEHGRLSSIALVDHPAADAIAHGRAVLLSYDAEADREVGEGERRSHAGVTRSLLIAPMKIGERSIGALWFSSASPGCYDERDAALAVEVARRTAYAIENGRLYAEATRQTRMREQILGVVSHDMRSPLNTVTMTTAVLAEIVVSDGAEASYRRALGIQERALQRMNRLIGDLLDFASIDAGHLSLSRRALDPLLVLNEVRDAFAGVAKARKVRLELDFERAPHVLADPDRLLQVLSNLVQNAIKISAPGTVVRLGMRPRPGDVIFEVRDQGAGIPEANLPHLFDRYWVGADVVYKGAGLGLGLGLAIAKDVVETHGGRIWVESALGVGTTFYFTIPVLPPPA
jgi:PAS domain S-box-containing protein